MARVTLSPHEVQVLVSAHVRAKFAGMVNHAPSEHVAVSFPTPVAPIECVLTVEANPRDARD